MPLPPESDLDPETQRDLWLGGLAALGPCLWLGLLVAVYAVSSHECGESSARLSWLLTGVGVLGVLGTLFLLERRRRHSRAELARLPASRAARVRFMLHLALAANASALLLLLSFAIPLLTLRPGE